MNERTTVEIDAQELEQLRYWAALGALAVSDARDALHYWDLSKPESGNHHLVLSAYSHSESLGWHYANEHWSEIERYRWPDETAKATA